MPEFGVSRSKLSPATYIGMLLLSSTAAADASSFVAVAPPKQPVSRSFVVLGAPEQPTKVAKAEAEPDVPAEARDPLADPPNPVYPVATPPPRQISRSIVAMGAGPAVTFEKVAAVGPARPARSAVQTVPLVIRGGIVGDLSVVAPQPLAPAAGARPQAVSAKGKAQGPATPRPRRPEAPPRRSDDPQAPAAPEPPPPPPPSMPMLRGQD